METATRYVIERLGRTGKRLDYFAGGSEHGPRFALAESGAYRFLYVEELAAVLNQLRAEDERHQYLPRPVP